MKKIKILSVLCLLLISLIPIGLAWASPEQSRPRIPVPAVSAQLRNLETEENLAIPVTYKVRPDGEGRYVAIYNINPEPALISPLSYTYRNASSGGNDPTGSVYGQIWVYYYGDDAALKMKIDYYKVKWQKLVSDVTWKNATLKAYCWSHECSNTYTVNCPSPGSWCYNYPPWRGVAQSWNDAAVNSGTGKITLTRGSSSWNFTIQVYVPGP